MSEADERYMDPSAPSKKGLNEEGTEVEGHLSRRNEDDSPDVEGKKGLNEDDGPEVEGHAYRDPQAARRFY